MSDPRATPAPDAGASSRAGGPTSIPPDEPAAARGLRRLDEGLGTLEGVALVLCVTLLIGVAVYEVVANTMLALHPTWPAEVIRYSVLFVAMGGASLAAQRQGMFNMDLVTRRLGQRTRSFLRIALAFLVAALCLLVVSRALDLRLKSFETTEDHEIFSVAHGYLAVILGFCLIAVHYLIHAAIEIAYLAAGRLPPEPPQGGH